MTSASRPATAPRTSAASAHVARLFADAGVVAVVSLVSPSPPTARVARAAARGAVRVPRGPRRHDLEECERRDPKGLYRRPGPGSCKGFTGVDAPYEAPERPRGRVPTAEVDVEPAVERSSALLTRLDAWGVLDARMCKYLPKVRLSTSLRYTPLR